MELDEAIAILIDLLKNEQAGRYGYDLYARRGAEAAALRLHPHNPDPRAQTMRDLSPVFYEAAWELCRRGLVRPGVRTADSQAVEEGGYSLTAAGRAALPTLDIAYAPGEDPGHGR